MEVSAAATVLESVFVLTDQSHVLEREEAGVRSDDHLASRRQSDAHDCPSNAIAKVVEAVFVRLVGSNKDTMSANAVRDLLDASCWVFVFCEVNLEGKSIMSADV